MNKVAEFNITESFNITQIGFVIVGTLISGDVISGDSIIFNDGVKEYTRKIVGVSHQTKFIQHQQNFIGCAIGLEIDPEKTYFKTVKLTSQMASIFRPE